MPDRVLLIGQGPTTQSALDSLLERFEVVALVRGLTGEALDPVIASAVRQGIDVLTDTSVAAVQEAVDELAPACVVVSSYDRILPPALLDRCAFVNVRYAPLPRYRGRANVNWAIINGEPETAVTVHVLTAELDAGPILFQQRMPIGPHDTVADLYARLNALQQASLAAAVERHLNGDPGIPQDEAKASYGCTRLPGNGEIDWTWPTREAYALVRALVDPYPGAFTHFEGRRVVVWRAAPAPEPRRRAAERVPGRVMGRSQKGGWVDALTGDGVLRLELVQPQGERCQPAAHLIRSLRATLGPLRGAAEATRSYATPAAYSENPPPLQFT